MVHDGTSRMVEGGVAAREGGRHGRGGGEEGRLDWLVGGGTQET